MMTGDWGLRPALLQAMGRAPMTARQWARPSGLVGHVSGRLMARGNDCLNEWVVDRLAERSTPPVRRVAEIGSGPGVGLTHLLAAFPTAQVWGIDQSAVMLRQARRRNASDSRTGRLTLVRGDTTAVGGIAPVDLIVAVQVLYFWPDPLTELRRLGNALTDGGMLSLGYQLHNTMPPTLQKAFPAAGYRLCTADADVTTLLREAGFKRVDVLARGPHRLQIGLPL
jgi:trans-aconitate methyltransferase